MAEGLLEQEERWIRQGMRLYREIWLTNKAKENVKTAQGILRHSRVQTTLDLYTDSDLDEMIAAQEKFINAVGISTGSIQ